MHSPMKNTEHIASYLRDTPLEAAAIATRVPQYTEVSGTPDFVDRMSAGALHDVDPTTESDAAPM